jgi:hypothetical protein
MTILNDIKDIVTVDNFVDRSDRCLYSATFQWVPRFRSRRGEGVRLAGAAAGPIDTITLIRL